LDEYGLEGAFKLLSKPIRRALVKRGFHKPTEPQNSSIPLILKGENVLLIAPTASGKTEAALLPVFSMFIESARNPGIKILYITPLRALNRDMLERFEWWGNELDIKVAVRHGDTAQSERASQARSPPDLLITTPETLQAILSGRVLRRHLLQLRWVIIDEVHELAEDKRGSQLTLALERLRYIVGRDFQIIGLSATIGTPEAVGRFLVGIGRPVKIVRVPVARTMKLKVIYPSPEPADYELAAKLYTHPEVASRLRLIRHLMEKYRSVLLFVNTRAIAEVLSSRFKVWDINFPISIHHGSLSKPSRIAAERGLKDGDLKGLVCTSSLELGIDVGHIDLVIQYMSPRQVTRLIQRVGRAGHRIGLMAKGVIITSDPDDTLEALVICRKALNEELEPLKIPEKPYDVLCHQIAALLMLRKRWYFNEILELYSRAYPYGSLNEKDLIKVLTYMHTRYPRFLWASFEDKVVLSPRNRRALYEYFFDKLSMIPDVKNYLVINSEDNVPLGVLDEVFVAEYGDPGRKFIFRGSVWKIREVIGDKIYVSSVEDPTGAIPSWVGEEIPVPLEVAREVGKLRGYVELKLAQNKTLKEIIRELSDKYPADEETFRKALKEVEEHVRLGIPVPTDKRVLVEKWEEFLIIHTHLGTLANRALARILADLLAEILGHSVGVQQDPYRVVIHASRTVKIEDVVEILKKLSNLDLDSMIVKLAERSGLFKRRLIHVARRFGALAKWADTTGMSIRRLIDMFKGTVIFEEALKEYLSTDVDINAIKDFADKISSNEIKIEALESVELSPLSRIGMEKLSMKTEIIPPERFRRILVEATKARLLNEVRIFLCTDCFDWWKPIRIIDLPGKPRCPKCGSRRLAALNEDERTVKKIAEKKGLKLTAEESSIMEEALKQAELIEKYGKLAAIALAGRRLKARDVESILERYGRESDAFYEKISELERKVLRRMFW